MAEGGGGARERIGGSAGGSEIPRAVSPRNLNRHDITSQFFHCQWAGYPQAT